MKRLKNLKKLSIDATTIRVLSNTETRLVNGGKTNTDTVGTGITPLCQKPATMGCVG